MPVHDWTRVFDGAFHDFHFAWIAELRNCLNSGLLPPDYYAMAEQVAGPIVPDVLTLQTTSGSDDGWSGEPIAGAIAHLREVEVEVEVGPVTRHGVHGQGTSVYFRDPDGSLLEFISYADASR